MRCLSVSLLASVLLTATFTQAEAARKYAVAVCRVAQQDLPEDLHPILSASDYIYNYQRKNPAFKSVDLSVFDREAKVTLQSQPRLGEFQVIPGQWGNHWHYHPRVTNGDGTYVGRDHFVVKVTYKRVVVFVHYFVEVTGNDPTTYIGDDGERHSHFCKRESWKLSQANGLFVLYWSS
jgi:hypothetical protein